MAPPEREGHDPQTDSGWHVENEAMDLHRAKALDCPAEGGASERASERVTERERENINRLTATKLKDGEILHSPTNSKGRQSCGVAPIAGKSKLAT